MSLRVDPKAIPSDVMTLCRELAKHGYKGWVVGGCLRDLLRGKPAADWDLATSAHPEQVQRTFKRVIPTGIQHGTVTVRLGGNSYEVTTLRGEGAYSDGRRPDHVEFVGDIAADLARRDFTINAIAYDPLADQLIDPFDGLGDLERRVIRAVGRAEERFSEDGLRVLRAARFAASLEFALDADTEAAIRPTLDTFRKVSAERVRDEWLKALKAHKPSLAFAVMARTGILEVTSPFLAQHGQLPAALRALDLSPPNSELRMAALCAGQRDDLAALDAWLTAYRFSNQERALIVALVRHHAACWQPVPDDAALRHFAAQVGRERLEGTLCVARVVAEGAADEGALANARAWTDRVQLAVTSDTPLVAKELAVNGGALMKELGITPGPRVGALIEALLARVIAEPALNQRERLIELARSLHTET